MTKAAESGYTSLRIEADPNALGFYQAMGASQIGEAPSGSIPGRTLPVLLVTLADAGTHPTLTRGGSPAVHGRGQAAPGP